MTTISGLAIQIARPLVSLVTLPLLYNKLGQNGLGIWLIALSMLGLLNFVSSGISASIITHVGRASASGDETSLTQLTTAGFLIAIVCTTVLGVIAFPLTNLLNWAWLFQLQGSAMESEVSHLMNVIAAMLCLSFIAVIPRQIMFGRMHGYLAHILDFLGVIAGAFGLIVALFVSAPLWVMAMLFIGPSVVLVFLGGMIYLALSKIPPFSPRDLDVATFRQVRDDAVRMSAYQVAYAVSSQTDMILIGIFLGSAAAAPFGVAQRIFSLIVLVGYALNQAQWPAMARADAAGNRLALLPLFRRTLLLAPLGSALLATTILIIYDPLIHLWLGKTVETDPLILWGMVFWVCVATAVNTCDSLLRARNETSFLMRAMAAMAIVNLAMTLLLLPLFGAAGAIWGSVIGCFVALLIPYTWRLRTDIFEARS